MAIYTNDKELTPLAWREFGNEGVFTMNPWYNGDREDLPEQWPKLRSNIYVMDNVSEFDQFFNFKRVAKDPTNIANKEKSD